MLEFAKKALDLIAFAVERPAEARLPLAIGFGRDVGDRALTLDQVADAARIIGFVAKHDRARLKLVEQLERGRCVVRMACRQAEPEGQALPIDDCMDLGGETAPGATQAMISTPLFAVAAC